MNPRGDYSNFTDAQLAEWHQHVTRIDNLTRELAIAHAQMIELRGANENLQHERKMLEENFRADFERLAQEVREAEEKALRDRNRFAFVAQLLPDFVGDFLATYEPFTDEALEPFMRERRKAARDLLTLLEPFAG